MDSSEIDRRWWKEAVVYQVYPRSFNDTDGDGVGDLPGVLEKVDYFADLGVDVVWLTPVYESPNVDGGYDVADFRAVDAELGTMADWAAVRDALHDRGMKLVMDLVVNHTSDEHEWFRRSREREGAYEDFYWWHEGLDAAESEREDPERAPNGTVAPNDWTSFFDGPAWTYDERRGEWYLHLFHRKQPDLYWPNPAVRTAMYETMEWWLDRGVDGFRLDAIAHLSKDPVVPTDADWPYPSAYHFATSGDRVHDYLSEMNERVGNADRLTIGEVSGSWVPTADVERYLAPDGDGLSMLVHFEHMLVDDAGAVWKRGDWTLPDLKGVFDRWQRTLAEAGWNALYLSSHDQPRQVSRFGSEAYRRESAKLLATLLHTLRGTPFVYQGEELGMTNYPWSSLDEFHDVGTVHPVERAIERGDVEDFAAVRDAVAANSRDNGRTPMQWTAGEHAGFTTGEPWLPVSPDADAVNVDAARADPDSVWHYYRDLLALRKSEAYGDLVVYGDYVPLTPLHGSLWAYTRTLDDEHLLVTLNVSDGETEFVLPDEAVVDAGADAECVLANYAVPASGIDRFTLRPWEARVYHVAGE